MTETLVRIAVALILACAPVLLGALGAAIVLCRWLNKNDLVISKRDAP
jgi:hypothetical protein